MSASSNISTLEALFAEMADFDQSESHATFLSIGGRGYYENPTSDLLRFFIKPTNAHKLGTLFIDAFLEVAAFEKAPNSEATLDVEREARTKEEKRIDLVVSSSKWLLMIENKIWHAQVNPFEQYEELAAKLANGRDTYFAILSPSGHTVRKNWIGVCYQNFIAAIDSRLAKCSPEIQASKWFHFAQDFTLHLSQELYTQTMTPEELAFVENNHQQLAEAAKLQRRYREHFKHSLPEFMNRVGNTEGSYSKDDGWCIRLKHPTWQNSNIAWFQDEGDGFKTKMTVYLENLSPDQLTQAKSAFDDQYDMEHWEEGNSRWQCWRTRSSYESSQDAEVILEKLLKATFSILKN